MLSQVTHGEPSGPRGELALQRFSWQEANVRGPGSNPDTPVNRFIAEREEANPQTASAVKQRLRTRSSSRLGQG